MIKGSGKTLGEIAAQARLFEVEMNTWLSAFISASIYFENNTPILLLALRFHLGTSFPDSPSAYKSGAARHITRSTAFLSLLSLALVLQLVNINYFEK